VVEEEVLSSSTPFRVTPEGGEVEDWWEVGMADLVPGDVTMVTIPVGVEDVVESGGVVETREIVPVASIRVVLGDAAWERVRKRLGRRRSDSRYRRGRMDVGIGWEAVIFMECLFSVWY